MKSKTTMEWKEIMDDNNIANKIARHYRDIPKDKQAGLNGYFDDVPYFEYDLHSIPTPHPIFLLQPQSDTESCPRLAVTPRLAIQSRKCKDAGWKSHLVGQHYPNTENTMVLTISLGVIHKGLHTTQKRGCT